MHNDPIEYFIFYKSDSLVKTRIGSNNDGGYVISTNKELENYDIIISGGAGNNTIFETELSERLNIPCHIFDCNQTDIIHSNKFIKFYQQRFCSLNLFLIEIIDKHNDIFLKLDIEGDEYSFIDSLYKERLNKFKQIVIEFHNIGSKNYNIAQLNKLLSTHIPIHFHANNCCGTEIFSNINIPTIFELTLIRKTDAKKLVPFYINNEKLPTQIDQPNLSFLPDIVLDYYPFCVPNQVFLDL